MQISCFLLLVSLLTEAACLPANREQQPQEFSGTVMNEKNHHTGPDPGVNTIHVFVALCDNKYQGIVPVPAKMGNGQDPDNNLYWGWGYGVRTYFKKSSEWLFIASRKIDTMVLERLIFKHRTKNYYLVADGYDGRFIKNCTVDFLNSLSGLQTDTIQINNHIIGINGHAKLLSLIGHNGLMDFQIPKMEENKDKKQRDCIILACISKNYFTPWLKTSNANPVLWTTGLMGPEAYTLHDALSAYVAGKSNEIIREKAATAYSTYTKCSFQAAKKLLVTGW